MFKWQITLDRHNTRLKPNYCTVSFLTPFIFCDYLPLKGQCQEIFCFWFFHESVSPQPKSIPLRPFQIFSKICGDICKSRCTTTTPAANFSTSLASGKIPVANLPPVSTTPANNGNNYQTVLTI
jgi:hypothetical protein